MALHGKHKKRMSKEAAFHEVEQNEPAVVAKTRRKKGKAAANRQKIAIALSKAGLSKQQRKSVRGSKHYSDAEVQSGKRVLSTITPAQMQTAQFTMPMHPGHTESMKMPAHSMVMQVRKAQARRYK